MFESRTKAKAAIAAGLVTVDGKPASSPAQTVAFGSALNGRPAHPWVGRGALKLDRALQLWPVRVAGRTVLDVGASTGGFTQVCLARGASRVYAVDVGRGQLHPGLAGDPRVISLEATDARNLTAGMIDKAPELIVSDVSFISLTKALSAALALSAPAADLVALVKPQFELGPDDVGRGGLVRDPIRRDRAVADVCKWLTAQGWPVLATTESPILGGHGAEETLLHARRASSVAT